MKKRLTPIITMLLAAVMAFAAVEATDATSKTKQNTNAEEARKLFDKVYDMVFGPQGCSLHYDVNIISLYKTSGTICYKGKKQRFSDERVDTWNDGKTEYMVY